MSPESPLNVVPVDVEFCLDSMRSYILEVVLNLCCDIFEKFLVQGSGGPLSSE